MASSMSVCLDDDLKRSAGCLAEHFTFTTFWRFRAELIEDV
jgi:predicted transcriptional regulator